MKTITMRTLSCGPDGTLLANKSYTVDNDKADELIAGGYAVLSKAKTRTAPPVETATAEPGENAAEPAGEKAVEPKAEAASGKAAIPKRDKPKRKKRVPKKNKK